MKLIRSEVRMYRTLADCDYVKRGGPVGWHLVRADWNDYASMYGSRAAVQVHHRGTMLLLLEILARAGIITARAFWRGVWVCL